MLQLGLPYFVPAALVLCLGALFFFLRLPRGAGARCLHFCRCALLASLGLELAGWANLPLTAFPPCQFPTLVLPFWSLLACALLLVLPGRLKISVAAITATVLGVALVAFLVGLPTRARFEGGVYSTAHKVYHPVLGYAPVSNCDVDARKYHGSQLIYDVRYRHDEHGRRRIPTQAGARKSLLCFGCSFTYGEGVQDAQTWPALVPGQGHDTNVYNYSFGGWGPAQMLDLLTIRDLSQEVGPGPCQAVYLYGPFQLERVAGSWNFQSGWGGALSRYELDEGRPVRRGPFSLTENPLSVLASSTVGATGLLRFFPPAFPVHLQDDATGQLAAAIFHEAQNRLNRQFGSCPLTVLCLNREHDNPALRGLLEAQGMRWADLTDQVQFQHLPHDAHPTVETHKQIAEAVARLYP